MRITIVDVSATDCSSPTRNTRATDARERIGKCKYHRVIAVSAADTTFDTEGTTYRKIDIEVACVGVGVRRCDGIQRCNRQALVLCMILSARMGITDGPTVRRRHAR